MKTKGIKRIYYITTDLEEGLRKLAYVRKTTLSSVVREAIEWYITLHGDVEPARVDCQKAHMMREVSSDAKDDRT